MADTLWKFAAILSKVGLAAALIGVFVVGYCFIKNQMKEDPNAKVPATDAGWIGTGAKIGLILLFSGIALSLFVIALRIIYPWGE
ncbi:MAG: hypothetical protein H0U98_11020 [Alphaproteobacteria bacterium]|nr:hypothetical protein [Alphaproteobacteria bacterium]